LGNAIENSLWAVGFFVVGIGLCRLLPEFDGPVRVVLAVAIIGIVGYLAFLMTIDVPMYLSRWRAGVADGSKLLGPLDGLRDVSTRWIVTHDFAKWKDEIPWMSLYFSAAVWASLALCVCYSLEDHLPRYRTEAAVKHPLTARHLVLDTHADRLRLRSSPPRALQNARYASSEANVAAGLVSRIRSSPAAATEANFGFERTREIYDQFSSRARGKNEHNL
jgi:hypothetical protein